MHLRHILSHKLVSCKLTEAFWVAVVAGSAAVTGEAGEVVLAHALTTGVTVVALRSSHLTVTRCHTTCHLSHDTCDKSVRH